MLGHGNQRERQALDDELRDRRALHEEQDASNPSCEAGWTTPLSGHEIRSAQRESAESSHSPSDESSFRAAADVLGHGRRSSRRRLRPRVARISGAIEGSGVRSWPSAGAYCHQGSKERLGIRQQLLNESSSPSQN